MPRRVQRLKQKQRQRQSQVVNVNIAHRISPPRPVLRRQQHAGASRHGLQVPARRPVYAPQPARQVIHWNDPVVRTSQPPANIMQELYTSLLMGQKVKNQEAAQAAAGTVNRQQADKPFEMEALDERIRQTVSSQIRHNKLMDKVREAALARQRQSEQEWWPNPPSEPVVPSEPVPPVSQPIPQPPPPDGETSDMRRHAPEPISASESDFPSPPESAPESPLVSPVSSGESEDPYDRLERELREGFQALSNIVEGRGKEQERLGRHFAGAISEAEGAEESKFGETEPRRPTVSTAEMGTQTTASLGGRRSKKAQEYLDQLARTGFNYSDPAEVFDIARTLKLGRDVEDVIQEAERELKSGEITPASSMGSKYDALLTRIEKAGIKERKRRGTFIR